MRQKALHSAWWAACFLAVGCQAGARRSAPPPPEASPTATKAAAQPVTPSMVAGPALEAPAIPGNQEGLAAATDPCAMQLGDVVVAMQLYYTWNKQLPGKLEELQPYAEKGTTLKLECPVTHEHYVYVPQGLRGNGIHDSLVVYDQSAAHRGERWGIVMAPPAKNSPVLMYVIPVSDTLLKAYGGTK